MKVLSWRTFLAYRQNNFDWFFLSLNPEQEYGAGSKNRMGKLGKQKLLYAPRIVVGIDCFSLAVVSDIRVVAKLEVQELIVNRSHEREQTSKGVDEKKIGPLATPNLGSCQCEENLIRRKNQIVATDTVTTVATLYCHHGHH